VQTKYQKGFRTGLGTGCMSQASAVQPAGDGPIEGSVKVGLGLAGCGMRSEAYGDLPVCCWYEGQAVFQKGI
jgi:hypothetical protein